MLNKFYEIIWIIASILIYIGSFVLSYNLGILKDTFMVFFASVSTIYITILTLWISRLFQKSILSGVSDNLKTDPASILTQIQVISSKVPTASNVAQIVQQLAALKISLSSLSDQTILIATQVVKTAINELNSGSSINKNALTQMLGTLSGHVTSGTATLATTLSTDLAANASNSVLLADLQALQDALGTDLANSTQSILFTSIQTIQNAIHAISSINPTTAKTLITPINALSVDANNSVISTNTWTLAQKLITGLSVSTPNLDTVITDLNNLKNALSFESNQSTSVTAALNAIEAAIPTIGNLAPNVLTPLNNLLPSLMVQQVLSISSAATKLSTDLASNASNSILLSDLNALQNALQAESLPLNSKIDTLISELTSGASLNQQDQASINSILNNISSINSANPGIQAAITSINSNINSNKINIQNLISGLNALNTSASSFQTSSNQQFTSVNNQITSILSSLDGLQAINNNIDTNVSSVLNNINNLNTTNNTIQSLVNTIQQQMGTDETTTGTLISNLTTLQASITQLSSSQANQYNTLSSSINDMISSLSAVNTLSANNKSNLDSILASAQSINSANTTISTTVSAIKTSLDSVNTSLSTALTSISSLQSSVNTASSSNTNSFTGINQKINSINSALSAGVSLSSMSQISTSLTNIQSSVVKTYTKATYLQAIAQLKQSFADMGYAATLGLEQLQAIDAIASPQTGLTLVFDESTANKCIGVSRGRVYKDTDGRYYHIDGYGIVGTLGDISGVIVSDQYLLFSSKQTAYLYVLNDTSIYESSDNSFFTQLNLADGSYGTNTFLIANGKIINYATNKPGVISTVPTNNVTTVYYYSYNNSLYTSTDFVKFTNPAGDVIYYLESEDVVPASAVSTVDGVLWAKIGLMSVQVLNPSIFTLSYESTNYGLYWSDSSVLLTNGIYSNPGNTKYLYLHKKNWYVSTDKITFNKIILDANQNPTGVDTSAAGTIYTFNNQVQTSAPATMTNAGKTYWQFGGILYVDPTNLGDTFVYYNNTVYAQQTPANSYNGREHYWIAVRYIPTYISSGTIFGSNNTILFNPVLGAFSLFSNSTNATLINPERNNPTGNVADNVFANAARTFYSSKSGYYIMIYRFRDALEGVSIVPNIIYNQAFSLNIQNGTLGKARNIFDKYPLTHTILATGSEYDEIYRFDYNNPGCQQLICKATGQGTLQYVGWCQRTQHFDASVPLNSSGGPLGGYFAFETTTYLGSSLIWDTPLVWDSSANQYTVVRDWGGGISGYVRSVPSGVIIAVNCKKLNTCGYINPACLEPYTFAKFYFPTHESYATYNSELRSYGVTSTNYQALAFVGALDATGGAKVAIPSIRASFSMSKAYQLVRPDFISSTTSDTSWNGSIGQIANGINNYWISNSYEGWNFPY